MSSYGPFEIYFTPFEYRNTNAKIALVGITPGRSQMTKSIDAFRAAMNAGLPYERAMQQASLTASFAGQMRSNLTKMLRHIGVTAALNLGYDDEIFDGPGRGMIECTSLCRHAIFKDNKNFSGAIDQHSFLYDHSKCYFREVSAACPAAMYIGLGSNVGRVLSKFEQEDIIPAGRVLGWLPHPSRANNEGVGYFLGRIPTMAQEARMASIYRGRQMIESRLPGLWTNRGIQ